MEVSFGVSYNFEFSWTADRQKFQHLRSQQTPTLRQNQNIQNLLEDVLCFAVQTWYGLLGFALRYGWLLVSRVSKEVFQADPILDDALHACFSRVEFDDTFKGSNGWVNWLWSWVVFLSSDSWQQTIWVQLCELFPCLHGLCLHLPYNQRSLVNTLRGEKSV